MTREKFIKKWLGNKDYQYTEQNRDLMRDDLDEVINQAFRQPAVMPSLPNGKRVLAAPALNKPVSGSLSLRLKDMLKRIWKYLNYIEREIQICREASLFGKL